ncbi:MAG: AAA family ATPase, partial [Candidatus Symbiothrix sp.]|nr:AAA family ATPase [Candidatus Symbiothrix sp.]
CEGSQREKLAEHSYLGDAFALMVAAASLQFPDIINKTKKLQLTPILKSGELLFKTNYPVICEKNLDKLLLINEGEDGEALITIPVLPDGNTIAPDTWIIANSKGENYIDELAANYIKFGDEALKGSGLPILQIGGLKTIDRFEIESFNNIRNLIVEYADKKFSKGEDITPLSIAVFGSPGSGKSFGVKQIAKSIGGNIKTDTVNVAQINNDDELGAAFQKVRDIILEDKLPLVFFDEFDSGELKWLKNFLMPMQDGKFKDTTGEHPLGKCILVFAGGTASTFKDFISPMSSPDETIQKVFKNVKGPDFVSRIKGTIDIAGPNRRNDSDRVCILRRVLLLRSLCERDERLKPTIAAGKEFIDENILRAMLYITEYKHGARSMETVLKMSKIKTGVWLPSDLPMGNQMSVHLNDRKFTDILLLKVIEQSLDGRIAQAIHQNYVEYMAKKKNQRPNTKPWENLTIEFKLSNLNQARSYHEKLALINCKMTLKDENKKRVTSFTKQEVLIMAKQEHQRWIDEKIEDGWVYASVRDDKKKHHDCIIEWDKLSEEVQNWDKEPVRNIIGVLDAVGYGVYRK